MSLPTLFTVIKMEVIATVSYSRSIFKYITRSTVRMFLIFLERNETLRTRKHSLKNGVGRSILDALVLKKFKMELHQ